MNEDLKKPPKRPAPQLKTSSSTHTQHKKQPQPHIFMHKACTLLESLSNTFSTLLHIPPSTRIIALVLLHTFYERNDLLLFSYYEIVPACFLIAVKVDDALGFDLSLNKLIAFISRKAAKNDLFSIDLGTDAGMKSHRRWCDAILNAEQSVLLSAKFMYAGDKDYEDMGRLCGGLTEEWTGRCMVLFLKCYQTSACVYFTWKELGSYAICRAGLMIDLIVGKGAITDLAKDIAHESYDEIHGIVVEYERGQIDMFRDAITVCVAKAVD